MADIDTTEDKKATKREIIKQNSKFDLNEIFVTRKYEGAVILITPKQTVSSYIKRIHEETAKNMYQTIFSEKLIGANKKMWQQQIADNNVICMQICKEGFQIIFFPPSISEKQYNMLREVLEKIDRISKTLDDNIDYMLSIDNREDEICTDNIDKIMEEAVNITHSKVTEKREELLSLSGEEIKKVAAKGRNARQLNGKLFEKINNVNVVNVNMDR